VYLNKKEPLRHVERIRIETSGATEDYSMLLDCTDGSEVRISIGSHRNTLERLMRTDGGIVHIRNPRTNEELIALNDERLQSILKQIARSHISSSHVVDHPLPNMASEYEAPSFHDAPSSLPVQLQFDVPSSSSELSTPCTLQVASSTTI